MCLTNRKSLYMRKKESNCDIHYSNKTALNSQPPLCTDFFRALGNSPAPPSYNTQHCKHNTKMLWLTGAQTQLFFIGLVSFKKSWQKTSYDHMTIHLVLLKEYIKNSDEWSEVNDKLDFTEMSWQSATWRNPSLSSTHPLTSQIKLSRSVDG